MSYVDLVRKVGQSKRDELAAEVQRREVARKLADLAKNNPAGLEQVAAVHTGRTSGGSSQGNPGAAMKAGWDQTWANAKFDPYSPGGAPNMSNGLAPGAGIPPTAMFNESPASLTTPSETDSERQRAIRAAEFARHDKFLSDEIAAQRASDARYAKAPVTLGINAAIAEKVAPKGADKINAEILKYQKAVFAHDQAVAGGDPAVIAKTTEAMRTASNDVMLTRKMYGEATASAEPAAPALPQPRVIPGQIDGNQTMLTNRPDYSASINPAPTTIYDPQATASAPATATVEPVAVTTSAATAVATRTLPDGTVQIKYSDGTISTQ
jgi:hypothetical protein